MIRPEQIPDEVERAYISATFRSDFLPKDVIAAAINAWPGMFHHPAREGEPSACFSPSLRRTAMSERIIECADREGEFVMLEDKFVYWWPKGRGCVGAHQLRVLADELDRRNASWEEPINDYFEAQENSDE